VEARGSASRGGTAGRGDGASGVRLTEMKARGYSRQFQRSPKSGANGPAARYCGCGALLLSACVGLAASGRAVADGTAAPPPPYSINAFIGYRVGGNFNDATTGQAVDLRDHESFAIAIDARADWNSNYELLYSRQATTLSGGNFVPTGTTVEYLHLGGTVTFDNATPQFQPYFGGGLGVTRFTPDTPVGTSDTRFSMSLSLGLRVPVSRYVQFRMEGRGYVSFVDTNTDFFCGSGANGAICQIHAHGSTIFQFELLAGGAVLF